MKPNYIDKINQLDSYAFEDLVVSLLFGYNGIELQPLGSSKPGITDGGRDAELKGFLKITKDDVGVEGKWAIQVKHVTGEPSNNNWRNKISNLLSNEKSKIKRLVGHKYDSYLFIVNSPEKGNNKNRGLNNDIRSMVENRVTKYGMKKVYYWTIRNVCAALENNYNVAKTYFPDPNSEKHMSELVCTFDDYKEPLTTICKFIRENHAKEILQSSLTFNTTISWKFKNRRFHYIENSQVGDIDEVLIVYSQISPRDVLIVDDSKNINLLKERVHFVIGSNLIKNKDNLLTFFDEIDEYRIGKKPLTI